ncbi:hypothetical protein N7457_004285 [Penicillium paradoxum]|uniref:uncharacterized protein n=1 Tax=Penicillium paradoxum TaxID=176176 RepID=UPI002548BA4F|nr:uncharacterized protein N7457_004285 [Penicillium paradoxum]KAJ5782511.1 hypothetical protein N7457_004285 [Penicillium paradoxum]
MNPTVEDENDSHASPNSEGAPIPWSEIFSRHEAVLCSHLEMLSMVKGQVASQADGFQAVTSMVNKTVQAMNQLKVARKHMMNKNSSASSTSSPFNPAQPADIEANTRKKRRRVSREKDTRSEPIEEVRAPKRYRDSSSQPPIGQDEDFGSISLGTEDISAEVQRRLKIKEEQRRRKENPKPDKRKRDSLASNDGASSAAPRPRKKRLRMETVHKREYDSMLDNETDSPKMKRRKTP